MTKKSFLYLIIQPNFRNGGAERSAINNQPDFIITYGEHADKKFIKNFENIKVFKSKLYVFIFLIKLSTKYNLLIETNQLSACYFWPLSLLPPISVNHSQRLSLRGELILSNSKIKKFLNFVAFQIAPVFIKVKVPSNDLINDFLFNRKKISYKANIIFKKNINFPESPSNKKNDIVVVSRNSKEKKIVETLELLNNVLNKKRKVTVIGCDLRKTFDNFKVKYIERIIDKEQYYRSFYA